MDESRSGVMQRKAPKHIFEDCISQLPDDILASIISRLTLKDAAATSVISRRWRYLWTYVTVLDFDDTCLNLKCPNIELRKFIKLDRHKYIHWVNNVVSSHRGLRLDKFKARIDSVIMAKSQIYEWIYFALTKGSEVLQLNFPCGFYADFSDDVLRCIRSNPNGLSWIKPLKTLKLHYTRVTDELLDLVLSRCPQLIILELSCTNGIKNLKIDHGASLQLQHLRIISCGVESIEISSAPNLVSFAYRGLAIGLRVENVPSLVGVSLSAVKDTNLTFAFVSLPKYLSQLEWLELEIGRINLGYHLRFPHGELGKLKHLTLRVCVRRGESLMGITRLINSSPSLEKFTLVFTGNPVVINTRGSNSVKKDAPCPHYNLKEVEFLHFSGGRADLELARYLLENAVILDKFVIRISDDSGLDYAREKWKDTAFKRAKKLESSLHRKIDFQIFYY